ncbi:hypothetical protein CLOP_g5885, partial [Closterium sp. NIES-67]
RWRRGPKGFPKSMDGWLRFNCPVVDGFVSSPFGWRWGSFHEGVDLAAEFGAPVLASDKGVVTFAGWSGGYGKLVTIAHDNGFTTRYGHCCIINARVGQRVARGSKWHVWGQLGEPRDPTCTSKFAREGRHWTRSSGATCDSRAGAGRHSSSAHLLSCRRHSAECAALLRCCLLPILLIQPDNTIQAAT